VELETTFYRLAIPASAVFDGAAIEHETVPPSDARILLRNPPSPLPQPEPSDAAAPAALRPFLGQNDPNPFNPQTRIRFRLSGHERVRLVVYDAGGRLRRVPVGQELAGGVVHEVEWDGCDATGRPLPSGVYLYEISTPSFTQARKTVLAR
jgi:hypothetical protein